MKVYLDVDGDKRLVGRADVPEGGGAPVVERAVLAVLAVPGKLVELLPGWAPLAS